MKFWISYWSKCTQLLCGPSPSCRSGCLFMTSADNSLDYWSPSVPSAEFHHAAASVGLLDHYRWIIDGLLMTQCGSEPVERVTQCQRRFRRSAGCQSDFILLMTHIYFDGPSKPAGVVLDQWRQKYQFINVDSDWLINHLQHTHTHTHTHTVNLKCYLVKFKYLCVWILKCFDLLIICLFVCLLRKLSGSIVTSQITF